MTSANIADEAIELISAAVDSKRWLTLAAKLILLGRAHADATIKESFAVNREDT